MSSLARAPSPVATAVPGTLLLHPVVLGAIAGFIVNDHLFKAAYPGWLTGKLSDVAGLIFFPVLVTTIAEFFSARVRRDASTVLSIVVVLTGLTYVVMLLVPAGGDGYRWFFGILQWPFRIALAVVSGSPIPGLAPVGFAADPTDLITLPALVVPFGLAVRGRREARSPAGSNPGLGR